MHFDELLADGQAQPSPAVLARNAGVLLRELGGQTLNFFRRNARSCRREILTCAYAIMMRKDDPAFKKAIDSAVIALYRSGDINKVCAKWFQAPIAPSGINLNLPMSDALKEPIRNPNKIPVHRMHRAAGGARCGAGLPNRDVGTLDRLKANR